MISKLFSALLANLNLSISATALSAIALSGTACQHPADTQSKTAASSGANSVIEVDATASTPVLLLRAEFEPRSVHQIEVGDFHFTPGQIAPVHTHAAPALGYVSKGSIVYQIEGQPVQLLKTGDAFYEPVGPQIVHFDNASETEEAIFTDFNFERPGEPSIVFPTPPVNFKLDRRTFPTVELAEGPSISAINIYAQTLAPEASVQRPIQALVVLGYVAEGAVSIRLPSGPLVVAAGKSFDVPAGLSDVTFTNPSRSVPAKVVLFEPAL